MKNVYPIVISPGDSFYVVYIPDFDINTQGETLSEAIDMARDAIGITGITWQDMEMDLPEASALNKVPKEQDDIVTLVDVDFADYRRKHDMRTVRRNVSLPAWLNAEADSAGINVSSVLQNALKAELGIVGR